MTEVYRTTPDLFLTYLGLAREASDRVAAFTTAPEDLSRENTYYLTLDGDSGFGITPEGEGVALFSLVKGRGEDLVRQVVSRGATKLDCFDGYLPTLYTRHGFREVRREANWTPGEPDVVFMELV